MTSSTEASRAGRCAPVRGLERDVRGGQRLLGPDDALRDRGLGHQVSACDLGRGQAAEQAQGERDPGLDWQHRMAGGEDQPQQVIFDLLGDGPVEPGRAVVRAIVGLKHPPDLGVLALQLPIPAELVDRPPLSHRHQPGAWVNRNATARPLFERRDDRVLGEFLGEVKIAARIPGQPGDQPSRLQPDHGLDSVLDLGIPHNVTLGAKAKRPSSVW